jgi:poly(3-hydroxybutyrate) depolymerase
MVVSLLTVLSTLGPAETNTIASPPPISSDSSFCASELTALERGGCFAPPMFTRKPTTLVVYLHGRYHEANFAEELDRQSRLARLATERGFAVLALQGEQGECTSDELADWTCWPSNEHNAQDGPVFVARLSAAVEAVRARIGQGPNVLLGFSNGGYFATLIATRALAPFDAVVVAHAGPVPPTAAHGKTPPMLLITADDDASDPDMRRLDDELTRLAAWPHVLVAREGSHGLPDWDLDIALTFFARALAEGLPLAPPLASRGGNVLSAHAWPTESTRSASTQGRPPTLPATQ